MAALAQRVGHDVRVVAATLVRSLGVGHRGPKTDVRDARVLSEASCRMGLPSVHIPTAISQEIKAICVSREALVKTRTQLIGRVRGYVRGRVGRVLRATPESLPKKVRKVLLEDAEDRDVDLGAELCSSVDIGTTWTPIDSSWSSRSDDSWLRRIEREDRRPTQRSVK